jgi:hypothetical protein
MFFVTYGEYNCERDGRGVIAGGRKMGLGAGHFRRERGGDLAGIGKTAGLLLGEHQLAVRLDLEDSAASLAELGLHAELPLDLFRQTGGARIVVSDGAVLDRHVSGHGLLLPGPIIGQTGRLPVRGMRTLQDRNEMACGTVGGV